MTYELLHERAVETTAYLQTHRVGFYYRVWRFCFTNWRSYDD